ncbi:MAG TPA: FAD-dependent oxidoreductase [Vicinamibacterales bacterium]
MSKPGHVVVLGGGPAGVTAAWRLAEHGIAATVLEREGAVGGMARTIRRGKYAVDFGPHTFHIRNTDESRRIIETIRPLFGPDPLVLTRGTRVLLHGKYYVYPLELMQVLFGLNPLLSLRIIADYAAATVGSMINPPKREDSFEAWGVRNLGRTLYELCFGKYSERVWGLHTSLISSKQAQRVAKLNLRDIVLRILGIKADPAAYFTEYMYPRAGISTLYDNMAARAREKGGRLLLNSTVTGIEHRDGSVKAVCYEQNGAAQRIECDGVINTLALPSLVAMMQPSLPDGVVAHARKLRYRSMRLINVVLGRDRLTDFHWVYLTDPQFRCNRMSEQKNVSRDMVPDGETVLVVELSCWKGDDMWTASDEQIFDIAMRDLENTGLGVQRSEVRDYWVAPLPGAYPVYELGFEDHLIPVLDAVSMANVHTIGRHGLFLNNSMDDNVLLGIRAADTIAEKGLDGRGWFKEMQAFSDLRFHGK